jgi:uncharacterized protein (UPF0332 family)
MSLDDLNNPVEFRLNRAQETIEDARVLARSERWNACANRLYYSCFNAISSLLLQNGFSSSKQTGVRALFNQHFVKTGKVTHELASIYNDLFERRLEGDYMDFVDFNRTQIEPWINKAQTLIDGIKSIMQ